MKKRIITNERFSVRFCFAMRGLGVKTVGQALKILQNAEGNCSINGVRVSRLRKELDEYVNA